MPAAPPRRLNKGGCFELHSFDAHHRPHHRLRHRAHGGTPLRRRWQQRRRRLLQRAGRRCAGVLPGAGHSVSHERDRYAGAHTPKTAIGKAFGRDRSHGSFTYRRMGVRFLAMVFTAVGHGIP